MVLSFSLGYPNFLVLYVSFNFNVIYYVSFSLRYPKFFVLYIYFLFILNFYILLIYMNQLMIHCNSILFLFLLIIEWNFGVSNLICTIEKNMRTRRN